MATASPTSERWLERNTIWKAGNSAMAQTGTAINNFAWIAAG
jgi:hypothetical protein